MSTVGIKSDPSGVGYWGVDANGNVFNRGSAGFYGTIYTATGIFPGDVCDLAPTPTGKGYWIFRTAGDGSVYAFGDAQFLGDPTLTNLIAGLTSNLAEGAGQGYWAFDNTGAVDAFGSAVYHGGSPGGVINIVALVATSSGDGYWLIGQDGAVYPFGDAPAVGALGSSFDIVGACPLPGSSYGFWAVDAIGGIYAKGDAAFINSLPGLSIAPSFFIADLAQTLDGGGQTLTDIGGNVYTIGDSSYLGKAA
jgi:hypothetical protein